MISISSRNLIKIILKIDRHYIVDFIIFHFYYIFYINHFHYFQFIYNSKFLYFMSFKCNKNEMGQFLNPFSSKLSQETDVIQETTRHDEIKQSQENEIFQETTR